MLNLASQTPADWVREAASQIEEVLLDHAHCEKKAAGAALRMLFRYPQHGFLQQPIAELAREELAHYQRMLGVLEARGIPFCRQKPSAYGGRLHQLIRAPEPVRAAVSVFHPSSAGVAALSKRVKENFDPRGLLNPGRMYAEL